MGNFPQVKMSFFILLTAYVFSSASQSPEDHVFYKGQAWPQFWMFVTPSRGVRTDILKRMKVHKLNGKGAIFRSECSVAFADQKTRVSDLNYKKASTGRFDFKTTFCSH